MIVHPFYESKTGTCTYILQSESNNQCAIIDPVLDFDLFSATISTDSADGLIQFIESKGWQLVWILETHIHADHLSAAYYIKSQIGGQIGIGESVSNVMKYWLPIFDMDMVFATEKQQFDCLWVDNQTFDLGDETIQVMNTPGHTPACVTYIADGVAFIGDTLFMPSLGTARCDFPGGDATVLFESIQKIYELSGDTKLYVGHEYPSDNEPPEFYQTVEQQKTTNLMLSESDTKASYVQKRESRDAQLSIPELLLPSLQVNLLAGHWQLLDSDKPYLKLPINQLIGR